MEDLEKAWALVEDIDEPRGGAKARAAERIATALAEARLDGFSEGYAEATLPWLERARMALGLLELARQQLDDTP